MQKSFELDIINHLSFSTSAPFPRFAQDNLILVKTNGITSSSKAIGENVEEIKSIKDDVLNLGATGDGVYSEKNDSNKEERKLDENDSQKRKDKEPSGKEENIENALVADENYVNRSEATDLMKDFFRNNLEDSDCRTFITTRGEVIIFDSNVYKGPVI